MWWRYQCQWWSAAKFSSMLGANSHRAGRDLYGATPAVTGALSHCHLIQRDNQLGLMIYVPFQHFSLIWRHHHCRWRDANFYLCSALFAIEQWGFFSVPYLLWHKTSLYNGHLWGPVTLTPICDTLCVLPTSGLRRLELEPKITSHLVFALPPKSPQPFLKLTKRPCNIKITKTYWSYRQTYLGQCTW